MLVKSKNVLNFQIFHTLFQVFDELTSGMRWNILNTTLVKIRSYAHKVLKIYELTLG